MNYFISRQGTEYGPYTLADLQRYVASGNILVADLARSEGMSDWIPVSQVIGNIPVPSFATLCAQEPIPTVVRDGKNIVVSRGAQLPPFCVKCGIPAEAHPKVFSWSNPLWALLILLNIIVYIIVYYATRKQMPLAVPLCEEHRRQGRTRAWIGGILLASSPLVLIIGAATGKDEIAGFGLLLMLVMLIAGLIVRSFASPLKAKKIDDAQGVFSGAGEPFLQIVEAPAVRSAGVAH